MENVMAWTNVDRIKQAALEAKIDALLLKLEESNQMYIREGLRVKSLTNLLHKLVAALNRITNGGV
jgi:hypothetical protein